MESGSGSEYLRNYLDFDLEIREGGPSGYYVAVRSPAGEAQEEMSFPFDDRELRNKLRDLEVALIRSGGTRRRISPEEQTVRDFGKRMFEALLVGDVRTRYLMSLDEAAQQDKGLRLKLRVQSPQLAVLPWEFLYDPDYGDYLCLSSDTPIVRYVDLRRPVRRLTVAPPLKVLGMVASPRSLDPLDVEHEKELVDEAIEELRADGLVELTWLEGQTWRHLQRAMRRGPWHVFHFVGHGDFDPEADEGVIALRDEETGRAHLLESRDLARLLDGHRYLRLVLLNSCEGARGSEGDPFSGTAATLVRRGIPAVVAMQYEITDRAAIEFSRAFYEATADGWPVDAAVGAGRTAVSVSLRNTLEWGTPVLYMRSPDGRLFDISAEARKPQRTQEKTDSRDREDQEGLLRRYRESVESAWTGGELDRHDVVRLRDLADELGLSSSAAANIEREVMGDIVEESLERQEPAAREEERRHHLDELYGRARRLHQDREWPMVVDVFAEIHAEDPAYPDPEGLLASAREALDRMRTVAGLYDQALRYMDGGEWQQALESFEEVQRLEPGYLETEELMSQVRLELAPPPTVEVPDLIGKSPDEARNILHATDLRLSILGKRPSDNVPKDRIFQQNPAVGNKAKRSSFVHTTVSSGPQEATATAPSGKRSTEARQAVSLSLSDQAFFDELTRACAKYTGPGYYVNEAIPRQNLADAHSSIPIPTNERVIALVDNSSILSRGIGLAVCGDGIRWRNYAENPVSKKIRGFLEWPVFADVPLREHQWAAEYGIEMGPDNVFVAWKNNTMDQRRLVNLLEDIQSLVKTSISH